MCLLEICTSLLDDLLKIWDELMLSWHELENASGVHPLPILNGIGISVNRAYSCLALTIPIWSSVVADLGSHMVDSLESLGLTLIIVFEQPVPRIHICTKDTHQEVDKRVSGGFSTSKTLKNIGKPWKLEYLETQVTFSGNLITSILWKPLKLYETSRNLKNRTQKRCLLWWDSKLPGFQVFKNLETCKNQQKLQN